MSQNKPNDGTTQPEVHLKKTEDYRESYANSVQVRMSVWDFQLVFGTMHQASPSDVDLNNFQGVYLSPQQAKALWNVLGHNLAQYEQTFGKLVLEPLPPAPAPPIPVIPVPGNSVN
jgi:hypothetical protein